jgi:putative DNA primase/helicase
MESRNEKLPRSGGPSGKGIVKTRESHFADITLCLEEFRAYLLTAYGVSLAGNLRADGHFHGIATDQDKRGAAPFRYCVHLDDPQNIYFQDLKRGFSGTWFPEDQAPLDPVERERRRREYEARRAEREKQIAEQHAKTAKWARAMWRRSVPAIPSHPYLERKGVGVHGLRFLPVWERRIYAEDGSFETVKVPSVLLVPMKDETGAIWNLQAIFPDACPELGRDKDFLGGGRKRGLFHWLGERTETVCLAEGYPLCQARCRLP